MREVARRNERSGTPAIVAGAGKAAAFAYLEDVRCLASHADPRTTRLYDRRHKQVTRNIVERIQCEGVD